MNLNFEIFTLKTGFVVQGHIYQSSWCLKTFVARLQETWVVLRREEMHLCHWSLGRRETCLYLQSLKYFCQFSGCRLGLWLMARLMSLPRCYFCQCQLSDTVSLCTSLFLFIRHEVQQFKISFWFSCLSSSLPFVPFTWFMYKNNICINCLKIRHKYLKM